MKDTLLLNSFPSNCSFPLNHHREGQIWYNMHSSSSWRCLLWCFWTLTGRKQAVSLAHALDYQPLSRIPLSIHLERKKTLSTCLHKYLILDLNPCLELFRCLAFQYTFRHKKFMIVLKTQNQTCFRLFSCI